MHVIRRSSQICNSGRKLPVKALKEEKLGFRGQGVCLFALTGWNWMVGVSARWSGRKVVLESYVVIYFFFFSSRRFPWNVLRSLSSGDWNPRYGQSSFLTPCLPLWSWNLSQPLHKPADFARPINFFSAEVVKMNAGSEYYRLERWEARLGRY